MNIHEYQAKALLKSYGAPVAEGVARGGSRGCVPDLYEVECLREKCAAWGPVEPLWVIERADGKDSDQYITFHEGRWQRIPSVADGA